MKLGSYFSNTLDASGLGLLGFPKFEVVVFRFKIYYSLIIVIYVTTPWVTLFLCCRYQNVYRGIYGRI